LYSTDSKTELALLSVYFLFIAVKQFLCTPNTFLFFSKTNLHYLKEVIVFLIMLTMFTNAYFEKTAYITIHCLLEKTCKVLFSWHAQYSLTHVSDSNALIVWNKPTKHKPDIFCEY